MSKVSEYTAASAVTDDDMLYLIDGTVSKRVTAATAKTYFQTGLSVDPSMGGDLSGTASNAQLVANSVGAAEIATGAVGISELSATGTASSSTFLRGDNSWQTPSGGSATKTVQDHGAAGTTETINATTAYCHVLLLDSSSCALSFTGWPSSGTEGEVELWINHGTTTASRTVTVPAGTKMPFGSPLVIPTTVASAEYHILVRTRDGGSTLYADMIGSEYGAP